MDNRTPPQPNLLRAKRTDEIISILGTDTARWREFNNLASQWDERASKAAKFIGDNQLVLDVGAGAMTLGKLIPISCTYFPADVVERSPGCQVVDLNKKEFPIGSFDWITFLGVFEYIHDIDWSLRQALTVASRMVVTYCSDIGTSIQARRGLGWVNDYNKFQFEEIVVKAGWTIETCEEIKRGPTNIQYMYSCLSSIKNS